MSIRPVLDAFARDLTAVPTVDDATAAALARRFRQGEAQARQALVLGGLHLVSRVLAEVADRGLPLPDLVDEGEVGLLRAIGAWDPDRHCGFTRFALAWIRQAVHRGRDERLGAVRVPAALAILVRRLRDILGQTTGALDHAALAQRLGVNPGHLPVLLRLAQSDACGSGPCACIVAPVPAGDDETAEILRYRFGLDGHPALPANEVAALLRLDPERVESTTRGALAGA